jgi:hypothetical protein
VSKTAEAAAVVALFSVLAVAATYPLVLRLSTHIASDAGDPVLLAWILAWDADRIRHGLAGLWDAPNFYPYRHTLLYSEHFLGVAAFTAPLQWATSNPILVYNLAFLAAFVTSGCGMYVLARSLTGRRDAALIAAMIFAFHPFRASHSSHLQLLMVGWLPLSAWALHRYFRTGRFGDLLASAMFYVLQALTSGYFAYYALPPLFIIGGYEAWHRRMLTRRLAAHLAIVIAVVVVVMLPVMRAYWSVRQEHGLRRSVDEIAAQSADAGDYFSASPSLLLWGGLGSGRGEHALFPGAAAIALGLLSFRLRPRSRVTGLYVAVLLAAFVFSLGPSPRALGHSLGFPGPYALWLRVMPGLDGIRVPARLAVVAQMALAILASFGAMWLVDHASSRSRVIGTATVGVLAIMIAAEGWARLGMPAFDPEGPPRDRQAYTYLKSLPQGAAIELPTSSDILREFTYQYMTLVHGHPIVNGHSGYVTPLVEWLWGGHSPLREAGRQSDAVAMLRSIGVRYLVVHRDFYEDRLLLDELIEVLDDQRQVVSHRTFGETTVAVLVAGEMREDIGDLERVPSASIAARASASPERVRFLFDEDRDTRWLSARPQSGNEWLQLDLDRPRDIQLVRLQVATRSFGDYPRDLAIDAVDETGSHPLFRGSALPHLARGIIADGAYPFIDIVLPPNSARSLRLSQRGATQTFFWSIHELQLLEGHGQSAGR